ncbi:hypothetical protein CAter282_3078 [Collimonas arenae]|uniref:Uncharacterized protein n=1 Tax=Collimonas arenae TaxID=279058 RepID=A0A127QL53_9BURK|nr:hypothetical protein CAter282_3078 [Collimonas arenae]
MGFPHGFECSHWQPLFNRVKIRDKNAYFEQWDGMTCADD